MSEFKLGELLVTSKPYAYVLCNEFRRLFCDYCLEEKDGLKCCSQCFYQYYCDRTCQKKAWGLHKNECKYIQKRAKNPPTLLRLISLIILKIKKHGKEDPFEEVHGRKVTYSTLLSHAEDIKNDIKQCQRRDLLFMDLDEYIGSENVPSLDEFTEIYGKMSINMFTIYNETRSIGHGLYLGGSIFDHSCDYDAVHVFDGPNLNVRMRRSVPHRDISKIHISYTDILNPTKERQELLKERYYFTCQCVYCTTFKFDDLMSKLLNDSDKSKVRALQSKKQLKDLEKMCDITKNYSIIKEYCMEALEIQNEVMANTNICKIKTMKIAFDICVELRQYAEAVKIGSILEEPYRLYYGNYHEILGLHLCKIGKILLFGGHSEAALPKLTEAEAILKITHGEQHYLYKDLQPLLHEAKFALLCKGSAKMSLS